MGYLLLSHYARPTHEIPDSPGLARWITYYNGHRPHSALAGATPDEVYEVQAGAPPYPGLAPDRAKPEDQLAA